jgi:hypothetical protein
MTDHATQPLTEEQPMRPAGGCSLAGPNGSRIPIEEPHAYSSRKGANTIFVRTCSLCGEIDWDDLHEQTVQRVADETHRLRAEADRARERTAEMMRRPGELAIQLAEIGGMVGYPDPSGIVEAVRSELSRLRAENTALAGKVAQAWSEGHAAALAAGCGSEDEFRHDLGVMLVSEEQRCQAAISENPLDPHLHGRLTGLQRARDIVTGNRIRAALGGDQDGGERDATR